jgi:hypothetical protein
MENKDILEQERELRNDPLYALLRDDRPQPPRESRERVRRTLDRIERPPFARLGAFARRAPVAFAAACMALALLLSGTVYAIGSWIGREDYKPGDYITTPADQRTEASAVPEIEQVVQGAAPRSEGCRFVLLPEMSDAEDLNGWRVKMGQNKYDEADWAWVREIRPEILEVLYDGTAFAYTIRLNTDHAAAFSREHHGDQWLDALVEQTLYTDTGRKIGTVTGETGLLEESCDGQGITLYSEDSLTEPLQGSGRVSFTAEIALQDVNVDDMAHIGLLGTVYYTFSFDLDEALKAANGDTRTAERRLSGHVVLTQEEGERMWNTPVHLDGVILEERASFRSTGIYLSYRVKEAPADWTAWMKRCLLSPTNEKGKFEGLSVSYTLGGDDTVYEPSFPEVTAQGDGTFAYTVILPIFPSDYEALKQQGVTVCLTLHAVDSFNGQPVDDTWSVAEFPEDGWDTTTAPQPLASFPLDLP